MKKQIDRSWRKGDHRTIGAIRFWQDHDTEDDALGKRGEIYCILRYLLPTISWSWIADIDRKMFVLAGPDEGDDGGQLERFLVYIARRYAIDRVYIRNCDREGEIIVATGTDCGRRYPADEQVMGIPDPVRYQCPFPEPTTSSCQLIMLKGRQLVEIVPGRSVRDLLMNSETLYNAMDLLEG